MRTVSYAVLVALNPDGELLMVRRPPDGLLGGLWEFPAVEIGEEDGTPEDPTPRGGEFGVGTPLHERCRARLEDLGVEFFRRPGRFSVLPEVRHAFTHLKVVYRPMVVTGARAGVAEAIPSDGVAALDCTAPDEGEGGHVLGHKWVPPDQIEQLPLPVAQRKILYNFFSTAMANAPPTPQQNDEKNP